MPSESPTSSLDAQFASDMRDYLAEIERVNPFDPLAADRLNELSQRRAGIEQRLREAFRFVDLQGQRIGSGATTLFGLGALTARQLFLFMKDETRLVEWSRQLSEAFDRKKSFIVAVWAFYLAIIALLLTIISLVRPS